MKISNKRELENIARSHSADIDYKDFVKIYRECRKDPYSFLTIDTTLRASDLVRFSKNLVQSYKNDSSWSNQNFGKKISKLRHSMIYRQKRLKYLHCLQFPFKDGF